MGTKNHERTSVLQVLLAPVFLLYSSRVVLSLRLTFAGFYINVIGTILCDDGFQCLKLTVNYTKENQKKK
jgi:hypothetical protein